MGFQGRFQLIAITAYSYVLNPFHTRYPEGTFGTNIFWSRVFCTVQYKNSLCEASKNSITFSSAGQNNKADKSHKVGGRVFLSLDILVSLRASSSSEYRLDCFKRALLRKLKRTFNMFQLLFLPFLWRRLPWRGIFRQNIASNKTPICFTKSLQSSKLRQIAAPGPVKSNSAQNLASIDAGIALTWLYADKWQCFEFSGNAQNL